MGYQVAIDAVETGKNIRKMMEERDLCYQDLCYICGVSSQAVFKWFYGQSLPKIDNLVIIAALFECKVDDILVVKGGDRGVSGTI